MRTILVTFVFLVAQLPAPALAVEVKSADSRVSLARFELKSLAGRRVRDKDLAGKVAVISFWATWCAPCKQELEALDALLKKRQDGELAVLAIATDGPETLSAVRSTVKRKRWSFLAAADPEGSVTAALNPRGSVPYTLFVDREGRIAYVHAGYRSGDEAKYAEIIAALVAEPH
ncbi:TlpA disulfide reductase family protein [Myxococcota bacterium]